jgi:hypothetical protein
VAAPKGQKPFEVEPKGFSAARVLRQAKLTVELTVHLTISLTVEVAKPSVVHDGRQLSLGEAELELGVALRVRFLTKKG